MNRDVRRPPQPPPRRGNLSSRATVLLLALLLLPTMAGVRLARWLDPQVIVVCFLAISTLTFWLYWYDKHRAEANGWRTPESTLHMAEFLGGWPAAYLAQRAFRHKIAKTRYQTVFWAIIALHEAVSFDFLHDWHYSRSVLLLLRA